MDALLHVSRGIDAVNMRLGRWLSWMIVVTVVISATNATIRKVFDTSSNAWLELQWILFGVVFLLCAPWTLLANEHIRIDIVNNMFSNRWRNIIELIGHALFLIPFCLIMITTAVPFFVRSFEINEQSMNAGGLPQWPAKSLIMIAFTLLLFQGVSEIIKRVAVMLGRIPDPHATPEHSPEMEAERLLSNRTQETRS